MQRDPIKGSRLDAMYSVPLTETLDIDSEISRLTLTPRNAFGPSPEPFHAYVIKEGRIYIPRFYGLQRFGTPECDNRILGEDMPDVEFKGTLTEVQQDAAHQFMARSINEEGRGGMLVLPCGYGKTILALFMVTQLLKRKACIVVHKNIIKDQWSAAILKFFPNLRIGYIQGSICDIQDKDIVIAMVMTVARKANHDIFDMFGTVVWDECHHLAAPATRGQDR